MTKQPNDQRNFRDEFLKEFDISELEQKFIYQKPGYVVESLREMDYFSWDKKGNMIIYYPQPNKGIATHNVKGDLVISCRQRLKNPFQDKNGNTVKYLTDGNNNIFFPPHMLEAYANKTPIPICGLVEGEKKAFVAAKYGFDILGISGIWNYMKVDKGEESNKQASLIPSLVDFIKVCQVERFVLIHDSDALDFSIKQQKSITYRPMSFYGAVKRFAELIFQEGCKLTYTYINPKASDKKLGLDDLIQMQTDKWVPVFDFAASIADEQSNYFVSTQIHFVKEAFIKDIFKLNTPDEFYQYHKAKLKGVNEFLFADGRYYEINHAEGELKEKKRELVRNVIEQQGMYFADSPKRGFVKISNFTMQVLFLLVSKQNPKRIVEFVNVEGQKFIDEFTMEDFTGVSSFRKRIEAHGNFMYFGEIYELMHLKNMLFSEEQIAIELNTLGWQRNHHFFAFSNGITESGRWYPVNEYGVVGFGKQSFYLPAFSSINTDADENYENERNFRHIENEIAFRDWASMITDVYGDNGYIGLCWAISALYRDIIFPEFKEFPLLNLFGQKGSGKSTMAKSLMCLFGEPQSAISLENASSTKKGIYRKFSQFRNAFIWLDEYKNTIHPDLIGLCKNLYDGIGYERAQTSNDNRTTSLNVHSSTIISGQDMPTADPALFTRVILLQFTQNSFTEQQVIRYNHLKVEEKRGLTKIVLDLVKHRELIKEQFKKRYSQLYSQLSDAMKTHTIPDRIIKNAAFLLAPAAILMDHKLIDFNASINQLQAKILDCIQAHAGLLKNNEEVGQWWSMVEILFSKGKISPEKDHFIFKDETVIIRFEHVWSEYAIEFRQQYGRPGLDKQTLLNYLKQTPEYKGLKSSTRFHTSNTSGYAFDYPALKISLSKSQPLDDVKEPSQQLVLENTTEKDLPF